MLGIWIVLIVSVLITILSLLLAREAYLQEGEESAWLFIGVAIMFLIPFGFSVIFLTGNFN